MYNRTNGWVTPQLSPITAALVYSTETETDYRDSRIII